MLYLLSELLLNCEMARMIYFPGRDSQEVGSLADRMP